jgi:hypothetical protein
MPEITTYNINLKTDPGICPTKVYNWIYITDYNLDRIPYIFISKKILDITKYNKNRRLFSVNLPKSINELSTILKNIICVYESKKDTDSHHSFKIVETNTTDNYHNGKLSITPEEFDTDDKWSNFVFNKFGYLFGIYSEPNLFKINQKQLDVTEVKTIINFPLYIPRKLFLTYKKTEYDDLIISPLIVPEKDITINIISENTNKYNINVPKIKLNILFKNDKFKLLIPKNTTNDILDIKSQFKILFNLLNSGDSYVKLKIETSSTDALFNLLKFEVLIGIFYIRFILNYSANSFQTNLDMENNVIPLPLTRTGSLGGNFDTIIMNKDSDWEYLIVENLPFNNRITDNIKITINSSNESVIKSFSKNVIPLNTSEDLRLQRFGDPRDYYNSSCLIKLNAIGLGKTKLTFSIDSNNQLIKNSHIDPIYLCSVGIITNTKKLLLNVSSGIRKQINIKTAPLSITKHLFDQNNFSILNVDSKEIPSQMLFSKLSTDYMSENLIMKAETDIDIKKDKKIELENINCDIHITHRTIINEEKTEIGKINNFEPETLDSDNITNGITLNVSGLKEGESEMIFLINSLQNIPYYLHHASNFCIPPKQFLKIRSIDKNDFRFDVWPANIINNEKTFLYREGITKDDNRYLYVSNGGPDLISCEKNKVYGWGKNNIYNVENIYNSGLFQIEDIMKYIEEHFEQDIKHTDKGMPGTCVLYYGYKINGKFEQQYWTKRGLNLDFYVRSVPNFDRKELERIGINKNISLTKEDKKNIMREIVVLNTPINKITKFYKNDNKLYLHCEGKKNLDDKDSEYIDKKIKLINIPNEIYENDIFVIKSIHRNWGDDIRYLFILDVAEGETFTIDDNLSMNTPNTNSGWIFDNTKELNEAEQKRQQSDLDDVLAKESKQINNLRSQLNEIRNRISNKSLLFDRRRVEIIAIIELEKLLNVETLFKDALENDYGDFNEMLQRSNGKLTELLNFQRIDLITFLKDNLKFTQKEINEKNTKKVTLRKETNILIDVVKQGIKDFLDIELNLDREVQIINSEIYEYNERIKAQQNIKEPVKAKIIRGGSIYNTLWLQSPLSDTMVKQPIIPQIWLKAQERYNLTLITRYTKENVTRTFEYSTNLNEIKDIDRYIRDIGENYGDREKNLLKKNMENQEKIKILTDSIKTVTILTEKTKIELEKAKLEKEIVDNKLLIQEGSQGGKGGLYYIDNKNNEWVYIWKEWKIDYFVKAVEGFNFNTVNKYSAVGVGRMEKPNLLLYCSGLEYLVGDSDPNFSYEVIGSYIRLINLNNIYTENSIFKAVEITIINSTDYILKIEPHESASLTNVLSIFTNLSYWKIVQERAPTLIVEEEEEVDPDKQYLINAEGDCVAIIPEKEVEQEELETADLTSQSAIKLLRDGTPIKWAETIEGSLLVKDFYKDKIFSCSKTRQIQIFSKISDKQKQGNKDNYYRDEYFPTMPQAEVCKTTFSIYTAGASNTTMEKNIYPTKEFWYPSKIEPVELKIVDIKTPTNFKAELRSRSGKVEIDLLWLTNSLYDYKVYKFESNADNPEWKLLKKVVGRMGITDPDVVEFDTYKYKVLSEKLIDGELVQSPFSNVITIFVCGNNKFPQGRYNTSTSNTVLYPGAKKNCEGKVIIQQSIFANTDNRMTKKQIFTMMAKKSGGGIKR